MKTLSVKYGLFAGLALLVVFMLPLNGFPQDPDSNFHIYLAFGQSNMEGYPGIEQQDKIDVNPRFQLLPAVNWPDGSRKKGEWTTAVPPLCRDGCGLCPADYFGRTLVDSLPDSIKIGIINVSVAGCAIEMFDEDKYQSYITGQADWMKNIANEYGGNPYGRLVEMAKAAQEDGVIRGFLLHQGESGSTSNQWANEVKKIYNDLIEELDLDAELIPLLAGDLLSPSSMVQGLPNTLENSYVISSQGLSGADQWHFTPSSYREFGKRYAIQMLDILRELEKTGAAEGKAAGGHSLGNVELKAGAAACSFEIPYRAFVSMKIYTLDGKEMAVLAEAEFHKGTYTLEFGRMTMPSGVFIIRMKTDSFSASRAIMAGSR
jgi:hypothetical protein